MAPPLNCRELRSIESILLDNTAAAPLFTPPSLHHKPNSQPRGKSPLHTKVCVYMPLHTFFLAKGKVLTTFLTNIWTVHLGGPKLAKPTWKATAAFIYIASTRWQRARVVGGFTWLPDGFWRASWILRCSEANGIRVMVAESLRPSPIHEIRRSFVQKGPGHLGLDGQHRKD